MWPEAPCALRVGSSSLCSKTKFPPTSQLIPVAQRNPGWLWSRVLVSPSANGGADYVCCVRAGGRYQLDLRTAESSKIRVMRRSIQALTHILKSFLLPPWLSGSVLCSPAAWKSLCFGLLQTMLLHPYACPGSLLVFDLQLCVTGGTGPLYFFCSLESW